MLPQIREYLQRPAVRRVLRGKVLEVGSFDVNGNVRDYVQSCGATYLGMDMRPGKNVDVVGNAHKMRFRSRAFDTVLSLDMFEHDDQPWVSVRECARVTKPGGHLVASVPGIGFHRHNHPKDYRRLTKPGLRALVEWGGYRVLSMWETTARHIMPQMYEAVERMLQQHMSRSYGVGTGLTIKLECAMGTTVFCLARKPRGG